METDWLAHYGVKGQKWGIRRYQNEDGTLTEEGHKALQEITYLHSQVYPFVRSLQELSDKKITMLVTKDEKEHYEQSRKKFDDLIKKYAKEKVQFIAAKRFDDKGNERIAVAFANYLDGDINNAPLSSIYEYELKKENSK